MEQGVNAAELNTAVAASNPNGTIDNSVPTSISELAENANTAFGAPPVLFQQSITTADNTNMSASVVVGNASVSPATSNPLAPSASDSPLMAKFKAAVIVALEHSDFLTSEPKRLEKAILAVTPPNPEARVRAQLQVHAEKTLYAKAAKDAERGHPFRPPTKEDITAEVEKGLIVWREKQANR